MKWMIACSGSVITDVIRLRMNQNPYDSPNQISNGAATRPSWRQHLVFASPTLAPLSAIGSIIAVVILHRDLGVGGAVLGSFETPMGLLFTFAAYMYMGFWVWMPLGFAMSLFISNEIMPDFEYRNLYTLLFVSCCVCCVLFVLFDPNGIFTYFQD